MDIPNSVLEQRRKALFNTMLKKKIPALLIREPKNVYYHTEFGHPQSTSPQGYLLAARDKFFLVTKPKYEESAKALSNHAVKVEILSPKKRLSTVCRRVLQKYDLETLCLENSAPTRLYSTLEKKLNPLRVVPKTPISAKLRIVKDRYEIDQIRSASEVADKVLKEFTNYIRPGVSERALAWKLEVLSRKLGAETLPFEPVILSGERAGIEHNKSSNKKLKSGEMILIRFAISRKHYSAVISRTIFLGRPTKQYKQRYKIVKRVQEKTLRRIRIGLKWENAYDESQKWFSKYRVAGAFDGSLGHGVGLSTKEGPHLVKKVSNDKRLKLGMVFAVTPGIHFPGWGGIEIGDTVVLTKRGADRLTTAEKDLISLMR